MILLYCILFVGFYLEGICSNFVSISTAFFNPLFALVTLVLLCPYCYRNQKKYYKICFWYGVLYDLIYTNTIFFHGLIFLMIGYISYYLYQLFSHHLMNTFMIVVISILVLRSVSYLLLCIVGSRIFSLFVLLHSITSSLIVNLIYTTILYFLLQRMLHKYSRLKI